MHYILSLGICIRFLIAILYFALCKLISRKILTNFSLLMQIFEEVLIENMKSDCQTTKLPIDHH